jgi:hypothetical protein
MGANNGGVTEVCCSDDDTLPCFPSLIERTGSTTAPTPAWPDATYPKSGDTTLVSVFCAPATGNVLVDPAVGLPGPVAMTLPGTQTWSYSPEPPSTTTTTAPVTTTTTSTTLPPGGCVDATDCADGDSCTDDQCNAGTCANPLLAGLDGARCRLDQTRGQPLCDPIDPAVQTALAKKLAKAGAALARAAGTTKPGKQARQKRIARASLRAVTHKAARLACKGKIPAECAQAIADAMAALEAAIGP